MPHLLSASSGRRYTVEEQLAAQMAQQRRLVKNVAMECGFVPFIDGKGQIVISVYVKRTFLVPLGFDNSISGDTNSSHLLLSEWRDLCRSEESLLASYLSHELGGHLCSHLQYSIQNFRAILNIIPPTNFIVYLYNETYLPVTGTVTLHISVHPVHRLGKEPGISLVTTRPKDNSSSPG